MSGDKKGPAIAWPLALPVSQNDVKEEVEAEAEPAEG